MTQRLRRCSESEEQRAKSKEQIAVSRVQIVINTFLKRRNINGS